MYLAIIELQVKVITVSHHNHSEWLRTKKNKQEIK